MHIGSGLPPSSPLILGHQMIMRTNSVWRMWNFCVAESRSHVVFWVPADRMQQRFVPICLTSVFMENAPAPCARSINWLFKLINHLIRLTSIRKAHPPLVSEASIAILAFALREVLEAKNLVEYLRSQAARSAREQWSMRSDAEAVPSSSRSNSSREEGAPGGAEASTSGDNSKELDIGELASRWMWFCAWSKG
eukprot:1157830-Pelagomonas_calceolata.AAC.3